MTYAFDPELAAAIPFLPAIDLADIDNSRRILRELIAALPPPDLTGLTITQVQVPFSGGRDVPVTLLRPEEAAAVRAALLYLHGGGFVAGDVDTEITGAAMLARDLGIFVASVEYRLAPENPYPAGLDDCMAALSWLHREAHTVGIDASRIGVFGQSAGGGLAAALALRARDEGGPPLCYQFLGIPELDDRLDTPSMARFVDTPMWSRPNAELSWRYYLGGLTEEVPCYAAPARATDVHGLPPAYVSAMEFDPLRDEAIDYAKRLLQAGVPVELHVYPGTFHGSAAIPNARVSRSMQAETVDALRRGLTLDRSPSDRPD